MSDFKRGCQIGLLALAACQSWPDEPAQPPAKGGPDDPGEQPSPPQPSPTSTVPTTGSDEQTTAGTSTSAGELPAATSSSTSSTDGTSTGPTPASCGDGELDPGEQCDESYQFNSDDAACTQSCKLATCGDGLVWTGEEACDHGADNNDVDYQGCTESCQWGPRCGDGLLQPDDEECDASAPPIEGLAPCDPDVCKFKARVAFVTAAKFSGALGGLALADAACAAAAATRGLDNASSFKAWLSDGVATPQSRLKKAAADPNYPYTRLDGQLLADDLSDLISHGPKLPLDVTETGAVLPPKDFAWTNIGADGEPFSAVNHCKEWTSESVVANARVGKISPASALDLPAWKSAHGWTSDVLRTCVTPAHLYCFED